MGVLIPVLILLMCSACAPAPAATISGTVTDASGKPIKDARIDHTGVMVFVPSVNSRIGPAPDETRTDNDGHFRVTTASPAIVIRTPGYESQRVRLRDDAKVRITLLRIKSQSSCKVSPRPAFKTKPANDVDYTATWYYIETQDGPKGIISGRGPSYSWGAPDNSQVWASVEYFEMMDENGMIDASGHSSDGKYWRSRSVFGAAAQYYGVNRETAEKLDCVMDQVPHP